MRRRVSTVGAEKKKNLLEDDVINHCKRLVIRLHDIKHNHFKEIPTGVSTLGAAKRKVQLEDNDDPKMKRKSLRKLEENSSKKRNCDQEDDDIILISDDSSSSKETSNQEDDIADKNSSSKENSDQEDIYISDENSSSEESSGSSQEDDIVNLSDERSSSQDSNSQEDDSSDIEEVSSNRRSGRNVVRVVYKEAKENSSDSSSSESSSDKESSSYKEDNSDNENVLGQRKSRRKVVRISYREHKRTSSDEDDSDEDTSSRRSRRNGVKKAKKISSDERSSSDKEEDTPRNGACKDKKSEYELLVERNKAEKMAFLKTLNIDEAKEEFLDLIGFNKVPSVGRPKGSHNKKKRKKTAEKTAILHSLKKKEAKEELLDLMGFEKPRCRRKGNRTKKKKKKTPPVHHKSNRLENTVTDLSEDALFRKAGINVSGTSNEEQIDVVIPYKLPFKKALELEELYEAFVKDVNMQKSEESETESENFLYHKKAIRNLDLDESNVAQVVKSRVTSLAWHPSPETLILAAGCWQNKHGLFLGLWNVDSESEPYRFKIHHEGVSKVQFNPWNPVQLVSSSKDGTLRSGDLVKHVFTEIYTTSDETYFTYFDFLSETTCIVAQNNGRVSVVDNRQGNKRSEKEQHTCHEYKHSIRTVSVHPVDKSYFLTAANQGSIRLWDLRNLRSKPVFEITHHKQCINSAYFSPITGNSILTTSLDNSICIFDSTDLTSDISLEQHIKHINRENEFSPPFRASWLPNSEEAFVISSADNNERIEVYDKNMDIFHKIFKDKIPGISNAHSFHPFRPAFAVADTNSNFFVFT